MITLKDYRREIKHFDLIISVILIYIIIKLINNYKTWFNIFGNIMNIISPFIFAIIIAYILNPLMKFIERKFSLSRKLSILFTYVFIIFFISIFTIYLLPKITYNIIDIVKSIPEFANEAQHFLNKIITEHNLKEVINSSGMNNLKPDFIIGKTSEFVVQILDKLLSKTWSFTNSFIKWIFGFIISIYVLYDKEKFMNVGKKIMFITFNEKNTLKIIELLKNLHYMIGLYIGTKALDSTIIGGIAFIGLTILKSPYPLLIALIVGVTNMIPYFGPFIGMIVAFTINIFFSLFKAIGVLVFLFFLQQFDAWYLDPKLIGGKVGLTPFLVIFAVTLGGGLYGPIGMILAVPIMAVIKLYVDKIIRKYDNKRIKQQKNTNEE
ncbi:AI-2E family transporter [Clostridium cochlearium]|nr:AI-2E family transporter [Clostridium cochlearium]